MSKKDTLYKNVIKSKKNDTNSVIINIDSNISNKMITKYWSISLISQLLLINLQGLMNSLEYRVHLSILQILYLIYLKQFLII
jgi:hypothetical protein